MSTELKSFQKYALAGFILKCGFEFTDWVCEVCPENTHGKATVWPRDHRAANFTSSNTTQVIPIVQKPESQFPVFVLMN